MKFFKLIPLWLLVVSGSWIYSQSRANDIDPASLPADVRNVLGEYVRILSSSASLQACAASFEKIAGGSLVTETGTLRKDVPEFSLKKDFQNIRFYEIPPRITRVNVSSTSGDGFGRTALRGKIYKIWISKKDGQPGMPAPVSILSPEGHPEIRTPRVVGIGSL